MSDNKEVIPSTEEFEARILLPAGLEGYVVTECDGFLVWSRPEDAKNVCFYDGDCRDVLTPTEFERLMRARTQQAVPQVAAPAGWRWVPKVPTEDMQIRGDEATSGYVDWDSDHVSDGREMSEMVDGIWSAMLDAAPAAPSQVVGKPAFPPRDLTKPAEQQGIFEKFTVRRNDGSDAPGGKHHGCRYFVLDLDHDQHAGPAMHAYAVSCRATHPVLAEDIESTWGRAEIPGPAVGQDAVDAARKFGIADAMEITLYEPVQQALADFARNQSAVSAARLVQTIDAAINSQKGQ